MSAALRGAWGLTGRIQGVSEKILSGEETAGVHVVAHHFDFVEFLESRGVGAHHDVLDFEGGAVHLEFDQKQKGFAGLDRVGLEDQDLLFFALFGLEGVGQVKRRLRLFIEIFEFV